MKKLKRIWQRLHLIIPLLTYDTMAMCLIKCGKDAKEWRISTDGYLVKATIKLYEAVEKRVEEIEQESALHEANEIIKTKPTL